MAVLPNAASPLYAGFLRMPQIVARSHVVLPLRVCSPAAFNRRWTSPMEQLRRPTQVKIWRTTRASSSSTSKRATPAPSCLSTER